MQHCLLRRRGLPHKGLPEEKGSEINNAVMRQALRSVMENLVTQLTGWFLPSSLVLRSRLPATRQHHHRLLHMYKIKRHVRL